PSRPSPSGALRSTEKPSSNHCAPAEAATLFTLFIASFRSVGWKSGSRGHFRRRGAAADVAPQVIAHAIGDRNREPAQQQVERNGQNQQPLGSEVHQGHDQRQKDAETQCYHHPEDDGGDQEHQQWYQISHYTHEPVAYGGDHPAVAQRDLGDADALHRIREQAQCEEDREYLEESRRESGRWWRRLLQRTGHHRV